jgi:ABC-type Mn2+/Zn2+ transport system permease subunit/Mn-dependent DtxR family transcriptional regulator
MLAGAMAFGVLTAFLTQTLHAYGKVPEDASMGVVFTSLFALGVVLLTNSANNLHLDADCVLYGLIDAVSLDTVTIAGREVPRTLQTLVPVFALTAAFVGFFWKELKIASFDPALATAMGFSAIVVHYLLMGMVAVVTVAAFEAVGSILVVAMLIVPAATAQLLTDRLKWMIFWAVVVGVIAAIAGCLTARWANTNVAGMMAVAAGAQFLTAVLFAPRHGLVSKSWHNLRLSLRIVSEDVIAMLYRLGEKGNEGFSATRAECAGFAGSGLIARLAVPWLRWRGSLQAVAGGRLELTERGRELGQSLVRSHRLWEAYLDQNFDLPADHLHEPASRIEHFIGPALQDRLARALDLPAVDPHGKAIPPAEAERAVE